MGIPRKGSRKVTIEGKPFLYLVKETHIPEEPDQKEISVTVQEDVAKPGRILQFRVGYGSSVTGFMVQHVVKQAFAQGWDPSERGRGFQLTNFEEYPANG